MSHPWYHTTLWRRLRKLQLDEFPLCQICLQIQRETSANTVDHIKPFKDSWELFIDRKNHQSVCSACHSRHKQIQEKSGILPGCDVNGFPLADNHPWSNYEKAINEKKEM